MIRIGIIGCGGISRTHARSVAAFPSRATVVAAADIVPERRSAFTEEFGVRTVERAEDLLDQPDVDCVLIALPNQLHAEVATKAARAGKHILLEKPMANTLEECDRIIEAASSSGVILSVGQSYRYHNGPWHARQILDRGELGEMVFAIGTFSKNWGVERRRDWHLDRSRGGGMWYANGVHTVNTLQWLASSPVIAVKGMSRQLFHPQALHPKMAADDASLALLQHENGLYTVAVVTGYRRGAKKDTLEITCTEGKIRSERERLWVGVDEEWQERPLEAVHDKVREWDEFLVCLEQGGEPPVPGAEARHTVEILLAVEESSATGWEVRLDQEVRL